MTSRFGFALTAGFGSMMVLTGILGFSQMRRAIQSQNELILAQEAYALTESLLSQVRADIYRINLNVRDYLLDPDAVNSAELKEQVLETRERIMSNLEQLEPRLPPSGDPKAIADLRDQVEDYITVLLPPLEWSPRLKSTLAGSYTRNVLLRRRSMIGALSERLQQINTANLRLATAPLQESQRVFQEWLRRLTYSVLLLSALVALLSIWWIFRLERQTRLAQSRAEMAERELRHLSQNLVQNQEAERKALSRELHDQVGQMLTALRVEIANLGRITATDPEQIRTHIRHAKALAEGAMKTVRDLAMGLRPSMLDDLGLGAAIGWQARQFSRLSGVPVNLEMDGALDALSDEQKTGLFRVVQEAFTNITRHAEAHSVDVHLDAAEDCVELTVSDDGKGMSLTAARSRGLGLLGMEERVRDLQGELTLSSQPGHGTSLRVRIPRNSHG